MKTLAIITFLLIFPNLHSQNAIKSNFMLNTEMSKSTSAITENGFKFTVLDAGINTRFDEYGSGFFKNKFIVITSRKIGGLDKVNSNTGESDKNIFCFDYDKTGNLSVPILFSHIINTPDHEDVISFSSNEATMYFTRSTKENPMFFNLYKTNLKPDSNGLWIDILKLNIGFNNASIDHPTVSPDGKKLYFSSNVSGGFGGFDLYSSDILLDGTLSVPINLGGTINTSEDDKFPTFSKDGKFLFFASKGHENLGGFDMFRSRIGDNTHGQVVNLGTTLNTKYDEIAMYFISNTKGYISSNKVFGKGGFDVFKFDLEVIKQLIEGKVLDKETLIALPNANIVLRDSENTILGTVKSDLKGNYKFNVLPFETYTISVEKDGFVPNAFDFDSNKGDSRSYKKNILLETIEAEIVEVEDEEVIQIENILFEFDKSSLKEESTIALDKVYKVLMTHPEMIINLNAHSDQNGASSYNLKLSERRAASAKMYLINKGIDSSRIVSKGFGESKPLVDCKDKCTEEEDAKNRRVEFIIMK
tara:strand:+ start:1691 stop:3283 length:1593 start_codon:yes stop_codon:yes gene_type:complete